MIIYYSVPEIWRVTDVIVIFSVWAIFCPFLLPPPPNSPKNQNEKKKCVEISLFYTSVPKIMIICYTCLRLTDVIVFFHFGLFFVLLQPKKSKFKKNEKNPWRYHYFIQVDYK